MLSKELIKKIIEFDYNARTMDKYDRRRYGTVSNRELLFGEHRGKEAGSKIGFYSTYGCGCCTMKDIVARPYWDARDGERVKDGAPTRKTLRYNVVVPEREYRGKNAAERNRREREVMVYHVAVRLNRNFLPVVKDVSHFSPKTGVIEFNDMGYHQLGGWIVYWNRSDYDNKSFKALILPRRAGEWSKVDYHWRGALTFPWHETVNVEDLKGTRYEWCQYVDGLGVGLCDWLALYRREPKVEMLAKAGLYDLISPAATKALQDKRVFQWFKDRMAKLGKIRFSVRDALWAARHGKEMKDARRHFGLVDEIKYRWRGGYSSYYGYGCPAHANLKVRFNYERIDKLLKKLHVKIEEYVRYLSECTRAGLDLRNEGTLYPPTGGGRKAFIDRIEALEAENEKREKAERRRRAREDRERARIERENEKRWIAETMKERGPELEAFQKSLDRTKTLTGCGYRIVLAKTQEELLKEGKRMGNCVGNGTYGRGIVAGDRLIVVVAGKGKIEGNNGKMVERRFDVEIDRKHWKMRQCYGPGNCTAPDEVRELAQRIAESLKAKAAELGRKKRERARRKAASVKTEKRNAA